MNRPEIPLWPLLLPLLFVAGCDFNESDPYREYTVVESYLVAENALPPVYLSRTLPIEQEYRFIDAAISNATVTLYLLDELGEKQATFPYRMTQWPGEYEPENGPPQNHRVQPGKSYLLEIEMAGRQPLRATTLVPGTFQVVSEVPDKVPYPQNFSITISRSSDNTRQNVYVVNTVAADPTYDNLVGFYRDLVAGDAKIEDFYNNASNLINEASFGRDSDGNILITYPPIGVAFLGKNELVIHSIDNNMYDYLRSHNVQLGGSTLSPGEIPNAIYHIDGGIGVFGSTSTDTISTTFYRPSSQ